MEKRFYFDTMNQPESRNITYYVHDAQGNVLATYMRIQDHRNPSMPTDEVYFSDWTMYGSARLGTSTVPDNLLESSYQPVNWITNVPSINNADKRFELTNHLGNVLATITGEVDYVDTTGIGGWQFTRPQIHTVQDYYAFGMLKPDRTISTGEYRFGFNGKENDNEVKGMGNSLDFGARMYDSRLGRWLAKDPDESKYSSWSTYNGFMCNPILIVDPNGKGGKVSKVRDSEGNVQSLVVTTVIYIYSDVVSMARLATLASEIKENIECNWNNVAIADNNGNVSENCPTANSPATNKAYPVRFEVTVIPVTKDEAQKNAENNTKERKDQEQQDVNFIKITDGGSQSFIDGNSGVFDLRQHTASGNTYAHEFGHMLGYKNWQQTDPTHFGEYYTDSPSIPFPLPLMSTGSASFCPLRLSTQSDVDGLNQGQGVGSALLGKSGTSGFIGDPNTNKIDPIR